MTLLEQLNQVEERMNAAFLKRRFDTFNLLASDRLQILKRARFLPEKEEIFELARKQSGRWTDLLSKSVRQFKQQQVQEQVLGGYASNPARSGRVINRSF